MAFEDSYWSMKRKREFPQKKLQINERIEVRSLDEGFQGSWHPGTVINCGKLKRLIRYENILDNDGGSYLVEEVTVSNALDGVVSSSKCNYRGLIRPLSPLVEFEKCDLKFGLCVDVQYKEAWWEGVIFDHCDGMEERSVFFPDLGDEMKIGIRQMRITQDWDEVTEKWRKRGSWVFLELIEEYQRKSYVGVSIKQIWYDIRAKKEFGVIGDWTLGVKDLWNEMVMKVVGDYFTLTVKETFAHLSIPEQESFELMSNVNSDTTFLGKEICEQKEPALPVKEDSPKFQNESSCDGANEVVSRAICFEKHEDRSSTYLSPIYQKPRVLSETDYCPEAVLQYALDASEKKFRTPWKEKVRKHLLYLGWKIDYWEDTSGAKHFRYKSPNEKEPKVHYSLIEVCEALQKEYNMNSSPSQNDHNIMHPTNALLNPSEKIQELNSSPRAVPPRAVAVVDEQDYCPQAVVEYYASHIFMKNRVERKEWISKAKNHLLTDGWTFDDPPPDNRKRGIIYMSPQNRRFSTLHAACRFCIKQSIPQWTISGRLPFNVSTINEENVDKVLSDDLLPKVAQMLPKESELHTTDSVPVNRSTENRNQKHLSDASLHKGAQALPKEPELHTTDNVATNRSIENQQQKHLSDALLHRVTQMLSKESELHTTDRVAANRSTEYRQRKHLSNASLQRVAQPLPKEPELHTTHRVAANRSTENQKRKCLRSSKPSLMKRHCNRLPPRVLRSHKRVQEVSVPCLSNQKPLSVLSWLIDSNMVLPRTKVYCCAKRNHRVAGEGRITRDGIKCNCCLRAYSLGGFEYHTSRTNTDRPSANIFLEDGRSLLECQIQIMQDHKTRNTMKKPMNDLCKGDNDHICSVCYYGGDLILCDQCPSSFHKMCLCLEDIPDGDWFCPSCRCGICGQSRINGDEDGHFLTCIQCEHKYHVMCVERKDIGNSKRYGENWFCGKGCEKIYDGLHKLLGERISVGVDNLTWTLIKFTDSQNLDSTKNHLMAESYSKLNVAVSMMHECFEPLKESSSNRDLMEDVIFSRWSQLSRLNFRGFYTVLLERNEELVSVATIRVYGEKVAEAPLIGTRLQYRRHGMCRILMNELEKKLKQLGVERLVLPAVPSVLDTWTSAFGFSKMTIIERSQFLDYSFLDFQDTIMCQKLLTNSPLTKIPSPDSVLPKEFQQKQDVFPGSCSTDTDKSSTVSEGYQAVVVDKREMLDQQMEMANIYDGNKEQLGSDVMDSVTMSMVKQPSHENQQSQNVTSQQCSFGKWNNPLKYYERRKVKKHDE